MMAVPVRAAVEAAAVLTQGAVAGVALTQVAPALAVVGAIPVPGAAAGVAQAVNEVVKKRA